MSKRAECLNEYKPIEERLGQVGVNKLGEYMEVIKCYPNYRVDVKFLDGNDCIINIKYDNLVEYNKDSGEAVMSQRNKMVLGEKIEALTPGRVGRSIEISALYDAEHNPIESTPHPYMTFVAKVSEPLSEGDIIRAAD